MKVIKVDALPACNFCGQAAKYDAPTLNGSWAYMCSLCLLVAGSAGTHAGVIGNEFALITDEERAIQEAIRRHPSGAEAKAARREKAREINAAIQSGDFDLVEDLVGDGDISEWI